MRNLFSKYTKAVRNLHKDERGMTGLETAIILIAFVTVAAVFGYAVLSAGLFSAERGKETIYAGIEQAKSNMEIAGSVIGESNNTTATQLGRIKFTVKNSIAGNPIDLTSNNGSGLNKCVISFTTDSVYYNNIKWSKTGIGADDGDNLLEVGEQFEITLDMADLGTSFTDPALTANQKFNIQVKPNLGSYITIQRTLPPQIDTIMDLH
jgi:archaeal flagellin FlaB